MNSIYVDSRFDDEKRRQLLYDGQLFVYSPRPSSLAFTNFAAEMIKEAFGKEDPTTAQYDMPVEEFVTDLRAAEAGLHPSSGDRSG